MHTCTHIYMSQPQRPPQSRYPNGHCFQSLDLPSVSTRDNQRLSGRIFDQNKRGNHKAGKVKMNLLSFEFQHDIVSCSRQNRGMNDWQVCRLQIDQGHKHLAVYAWPIPWKRDVHPWKRDVHLGTIFHSFFASWSDNGCWNTQTIVCKCKLSFSPPLCPISWKLTRKNTKRKKLDVSLQEQLTTQTDRQTEIDSVPLVSLVSISPWHEVGPNWCLQSCRDRQIYCR